MRKATTARGVRSRSPSFSPERLAPTRGEYQGDISGKSWTAKLPKSRAAKDIYLSQPAPCIQYKPEFQLRLRKKIVPAGLSAKFTCSIRARPDPKITWMKQESGIVLENGAKYTIASLAGVATLTINCCEERDIGTYRCTAKNAAGETSDYAQLEVTKSDFDVKNNKLENSKFDLNEYSMDFWTRSRAHETAHIPTPSDNGSVTSGRNTINMPYFIRKPEDVELTEGQDTVIYASCDAKPTARVTWTKDGMAVQDCGRIRLRSKGNQYRMEVDSVKFTDAGIYKVYAENVNGKAMASFRIDVNVRRRSTSDAVSVTSRGSRGSRSKMSQGPRLLQAAQGQVRLDGTFRIECSVLDAGSVKNVVWYKDDLRVTDYTDRIALNERAGIYNLNICDLALRDSGSYACHIAGIGGGQSTTQFNITRDQVQSYMNTIAKLKKNGPVTSCGGVSLPHSSRQSRTSSEAEMMQQTTMRASMESVSHSYSSGAQETHPAVEPLPNDVDVTVGKALVLTTSWSGVVKNVQWYFNGMKVEEDDRVRLDICGATATLSILKAKPEDAGLYRVTVTNEHGSDTSEVIVTII